MKKKQNKKTNILRTIEQQQKPDNNNKIVILSHQIENQSRECCTYGVRYWRARATNKQTNGSEKSKFKKVVCFGFFFVLFLFDLVRVCFYLAKLDSCFTFFASRSEANDYFCRRVWGGGGGDGKTQKPVSICGIR